MNTIYNLCLTIALPHEICLNVLSNLPAADLACCCRVSEKWKSLAENDSLWKALFSAFPDANIETKAHAKERFSIYRPASTQEQLIEKIKFFFTHHKQEGGQAVALRYQSGSQPASFWHYVIHKGTYGKHNIEKAPPTLNIIGYGEADLAVNDHTWKKNTIDPFPYFLPSYGTKVRVYSINEEIKGCNLSAISQIAVKCNINPDDDSNYASS